MKTLTVESSGALIIHLIRSHLLRVIETFAVSELS